MPMVHFIGDKMITGGILLKVSTFVPLSKSTTHNKKMFFQDNALNLHNSEQKVSSSANHYENTPMQYTAIFHSCKNDNFQFNFFDFFSYFCSKHILLVHVRTASMRRF